MSEAVTVCQQGLSDWGISLVAVRCPECDWHYLVPTEQPTQRCPHCFRADLLAMEAPVKHLPYRSPPELMIPFRVSVNTVKQHVDVFSDGIPFAPQDLNVDTLYARLRCFYLPMWLADNDVRAVWAGEVGFDYQVVSHRERYNEEGGWATEEQHERRTRWEPRAGRLERHYDNVMAPALDDHHALLHALGRYPHREAQGYQAQALDDALVRLPDRAPDTAWTDALPAFQQAAAEECRQAAQADRIRRFRWSPTFADPNWTLLLLPVYATYYLDDDAQPQPVLINGQTGKVSGARRASMQRAQQTALIIAIIALLIFVLAICLGVVGLTVPPLLVAGIVLGLFAFGGGSIAALMPIVRVARFNRKRASMKGELA